MRKLAVLLLTLAATAAGAVTAQDLPIRVGRIAYVEGPVSLYRDPDEGWEKAYMNFPLTSENSVWTDSGARAEVRVSGMAVGLDELTQLDVARLDEDAVDAYVASGSIALRVRHIEKGERLVFNTPNARVRIRANGRYRIDVDPERLETRITVFSGDARVGTDDGRLRVGAGRTLIVFDADPPQFYEEAARSDEFDRWTLARDERWREGRAPTYVSTYMTGYEDLDAYGTWATEPDYGVLWYPRSVAANWAPYRHGRWDYVRPWGWTWIDEAPWGYAPFHYGRWVYVRNRWAWHPGERVARPVWAPALVAWIGGTNFDARVSSGGPAIGWYPLSPWDRYEPWFQASPTYVNRVNVIVRDRPTRDDRRQWHQSTRERGTTVVERTTMVERRPVASAAIAFTPEVIRRMQAAPQPQAVLPSRTDYIQLLREQPRQAAPAPREPSVAQPIARPGQEGQRAQPPGQSSVARPDFGRRPTAAAPERASAPPARRPDTAAPGAPAREAQRERQERAQREDEQRQRATQQGEDRAQRESQQQRQREAQQGQERAQREAQQAQERAQREAQQQQQRGAEQAQERAQREAQQQQRAAAQAQERAQREAQQQQQQQQQQQAQERAQQEAQQQQRAAQQQQQAQERAQREAQQQQQRGAQQAQERAQREAQERAQREAQQQQQRAAAQAQERAQREVQQQQQQQQQQQAQERAQQEAQQQQRAAQQQQQAQERAQREAQQQQQAQERAQREAQQRAAQPPAQPAAQPPAQPAPPAAKPAKPQDAPQRGRGRDDDDDEEKEKGKGKGRER